LHCPATKLTALEAVAMGERQMRLRRAADRRADAGDDLDRHARRAAGLGFLAAAPEDEGIAALERTTSRPASASRTSRALISSCGMVWRARLFATEISRNEIDSPAP
jgi:hypothetical protein